MTTLQHDGVIHASHTINRRVESLLDDVSEIRTRLDRLVAEATAIQQSGFDAPQFSTSVGGGSMNVDARRYAELDAAVQVINELRTVVALSAK